MHFFPACLFPVKCLNQVWGRGCGVERGSSHRAHAYRTGDFAPLRHPAHQHCRPGVPQAQGNGHTLYWFSFNCVVSCYIYYLGLLRRLFPYLKMISESWHLVRRQPAAHSFPWEPPWLSVCLVIFSFLCFSVWKVPCAMCDVFKHLPWISERTYTLCPWKLELD